MKSEIYTFAKGCRRGSYVISYNWPHVRVLFLLLFETRWVIDPWRFPFCTHTVFSIYSPSDLYRRIILKIFSWLRHVVYVHNIYMNKPAKFCRRLWNLLQRTTIFFLLSHFRADMHGPQWVLYVMQHREWKDKRSGVGKWQMVRTQQTCQTLSNVFCRLLLSFVSPFWQFSYAG